MLIKLVRFDILVKIVVVVSLLHISNYLSGDIAITQAMEQQRDDIIMVLPDQDAAEDVRGHYDDLGMFFVNNISSIDIYFKGDVLGEGLAIRVLSGSNPELRLYEPLTFSWSSVNVTANGVNLGEFPTTSLGKQPPSLFRGELVISGDLPLDWSVYVGIDVAIDNFSSREEFDGRVKDLSSYAASTYSSEVVLYYEDSSLYLETHLGRVRFLEFILGGVVIILLLSLLQHMDRVSISHKKDEFHLLVYRGEDPGRLSWQILFTLMMEMLIAGSVAIFITGLWLLWENVLILVVAIPAISLVSARGELYAYEPRDIMDFSNPVERWTVRIAFVLALIPWMFRLSSLVSQAFSRTTRSLVIILASSLVSAAILLGVVQKVLPHLVTDNPLDDVISKITFRNIRLNWEKKLVGYFVLSLILLIASISLSPSRTPAVMYWGECECDGSVSGFSSTTTYFNGIGLTGLVTSNKTLGEAYGFDLSKPGDIYVHENTDLLFRKKQMLLNLGNLSLIDVQMKGVYPNINFPVKADFILYLESLPQITYIVVSSEENFARINEELSPRWFAVQQPDALDLALRNQHDALSQWRGGLVVFGALIMAVIGYFGDYGIHDYRNMLIRGLNKSEFRKLLALHGVRLLVLVVIFQIASLYVQHLMFNWFGILGWDVGWYTGITSFIILGEALGSQARLYFSLRN